MSFRHRIVVHFADVDHAGVVYHPVFFDYFHRTIEALFFARLGPRSYAALLDEERLGLPAVRSECDFRAPVRFGDLLDIDLSVSQLGKSSVTFDFRVYRSGNDSDDDDGAALLVAEGRTVSAIVDLEAFRAVAIPARLRDVFGDLQS